MLTSDHFGLSKMKYIHYLNFSIKYFAKENIGGKLCVVGSAAPYIAQLDSGMSHLIS